MYTRRQQRRTGWNSHCRAWSSSCSSVTAPLQCCFLCAMLFPAFAIMIVICVASRAPSTALYIFLSVIYFFFAGGACWPPPSAFMAAFLAIFSCKALASASRRAFGSPLVVVALVFLAARACALYTIISMSERNIAPRSVPLEILDRHVSVRADTTVMRNSPLGPRLSGFHAPSFLSRCTKRERKKCVISSARKREHMHRVSH
jgi:hypothetical protein